MITILSNKKYVQQLFQTSFIYIIHLYRNQLLMFIKTIYFSCSFICISMLSRCLKFKELRRFLISHVPRHVYHWWKSKKNHECLLLSTRDKKLYVMRKEKHTNWHEKKEINKKSYEISRV